MAREETVDKCSEAYVSNIFSLPLYGSISVFPQMSDYAAGMHGYFRRQGAGMMGID